MHTQYLQHLLPFENTLPCGMGYDGPINMGQAQLASQRRGTPTHRPSRAHAAEHRSFCHGPASLLSTRHYRYALPSLTELRGTVWGGGRATDEGVRATRYASDQEVEF